MNETIACFIGLIALFAILAPLARTLAGDGYGLRPPPRRAGEQRLSWTLPHDETRRTR